MSQKARRDSYIPHLIRSTLFLALEDQANQSLRLAIVRFLFFLDPRTAPWKNLRAGGGAIRSTLLWLCLKVSSLLVSLPLQPVRVSHVGRIPHHSFLGHDLRKLARYEGGGTILLLPGTFAISSGFPNSVREGVKTSHRPGIGKWSITYERQGPPGGVDSGPTKFGRLGPGTGDLAFVNAQMWSYVDYFWQSWPLAHDPPASTDSKSANLTRSNQLAMCLLTEGVVGT